MVIYFFAAASEEHMILSECQVTGFESNDLFNEAELPCVIDCKIRLPLKSGWQLSDFYGDAVLSTIRNLMQILREE